MNKRLLKNMIIIILLSISIIIISGCDDDDKGILINLEKDDSIIYNGFRYYPIPYDGLEYYVDYQDPEIGYFKNLLFPRQYLYMAKANDNLIYSVYGTGRAYYLFEDVWVKEGYSFPDYDTIITKLYLSSDFNDVEYRLEVDKKSFNDIFIEVDNMPDKTWIVEEDGLDCLCLLYEDEQLEQTIIKGIRTFREDEYGNFYFSCRDEDDIICYTFNDELTYLVKKYLSK